MHVQDAVSSYLFKIDNYDRMQGEAFNVGDENMNYTKKAIALSIQENVDYFLYEADIGEDLDKRYYEVSYDKIKNLGYTAKITLKDGI
ncbi:MAG: NAD(P)-dependent oxidoreductase [Actinomycetia bacterium]|nr:NAD(P)-dependent oxidoreductase [Actinomycetes bacterium]